MRFSFRAALCAAAVVLSFSLMADNAFAACPAGQSANYIVKGKCVKNTDKTAGLNLFKAKGCAVCHAGAGTLAPAKNVAKKLKVGNAGTATAFIAMFKQYASVMPGVKAPSKAEATKYLNYLATIKQ